MNPLEEQLRRDLQRAAAELTPGQTTLHHPGDTWEWEERRPRRRRALAVAASVAATIGLTAAVMSWGGLADRVLPAGPLTPARVEQARQDLRAIEAGLPGVLALQVETERACMARNGFDDYLGPVVGDSQPSPYSLLSGRRSVEEAREQGYGMSAYRDYTVRREAMSHDEQQRYDWVWDPPDPDWDANPLRAAYDTAHDRLTHRPDCRQEGMDAIWGDDSTLAAAMVHAQKTYLSEAAARGISKEDFGQAPQGATAWRRCMLEHPVVRSVLGPGPHTSYVGADIQSALMDAFGIGAGELKRRTPEQLTKARKLEQTLAERDAVCTARPEVLQGIAEKETYQTRYVLSFDPRRVDTIHAWREALDRVRARHGL